MLRSDTSSLGPLVDFNQWRMSVSLEAMDEDERRLFVHNAALLGQNQTLLRVLGLVEALQLQVLQESDDPDSCAVRDAQYLLRAIRKLRQTFRAFADDEAIAARAREVKTR